MICACANNYAYGTRTGMGAVCMNHMLGCISRIVNNKERIVSETFPAVMDDLGYNVRLVYEKQEETE